MARSSNSTLVAGAAAGALAGFAASWAMNLAARLYARATTSKSADPAENASRIYLSELAWIERADPTGEGAERFARRFLHRNLTEHEIDIARDVIHYAFGTLAGAAYGALAVDHPKITRGCGLLFAAGLLIVGEEIFNPAAGLLAPPTQLPLEAHASMLVSHILYGLSLESVRRLADVALERRPDLTR